MAHPKSQKVWTEMLVQVECTFAGMRESRAKIHMYKLYGNQLPFEDLKIYKLPKFVL